MLKEPGIYDRSFCQLADHDISLDIIAQLTISQIRTAKIVTTVLWKLSNGNQNTVVFGSNGNQCATGLGILTGGRSRITII